MSDGMNDADGTSWGRKIRKYFKEFEELSSKILQDEPQLYEKLKQILWVAYLEEHQCNRREKDE